MKKIFKKFISMRELKLNILTGKFFFFSNKVFELQFQYGSKWLTEYFDFSIRWSKKGDHAGLKIEISILELFICFQIYDTRHWHNEKDRWMTEKEHEEEWEEEEDFQ